MKRLLTLRPLAVALLLALCAACPESSTERTMARSSPQQSVASDPLDSRGDPTTELAAGADAGAAPAQETKPARREAAAAPPLPEQVRVVIVEKETGKPVPGAEVLLIDAEGSERARDLIDLLLHDPAGFHIDDLFTRMGRLVHADAAGELWLARSAAPFGFVARTPVLWGWGELTFDTQSTLRIEIERSLTLRVRVVDGSGRPRAGVPVSLRLGEGDRAEYVRTIVSRAPDGRADFPHVSFILDMEEVVSALDSGLFVTLVTPGAPTAELELDWLDLPSEVIELVVPPTGEVEVRLFDECDLPLLSSGLVVLGLPREGESEPTPQPSEMTWTAFEGESALVSCVGLGQQFLVTVSTQDYAPFSQVVDGPRSPGERVTVAMKVGARLPQLRGRFVDEAGAPVAERELVVELQGTRHARALTTDRDGSFELTLRKQFLEGLAHLLVSSDRVPSHGSLGGRFRETLPLRPEGKDLGQIVLRPHRRLVTGSVLWEGGEPARGAYVTVTGPILGSRLDETLSVITNVNGRFVVYGLVEGAGDLSVEAGHEESGDSAVATVQVGTSDVRLMLRRLGKVEGRVLLDKGVDLEELRIHGGGENQLFGDPCDDDGTFRLLQVAPGVRTIRVAVDDQGMFGELLAEVHGIVVAEGATVRDPRLNPLDLRGKVGSIVVRAKDAEGRPIRDPTLSWRPAGAEEWRKPLEMPRGRKSLIFPGTSVDLRIEAPGRLALERNGVGEDLVAVLEVDPAVQR